MPCRLSTPSATMEGNKLIASHNSVCHSLFFGHYKETFKMYGVILQVHDPFLFYTLYNKVYICCFIIYDLYIWIWLQPVMNSHWKRVSKIWCKSVRKIHKTTIFSLTIIFISLQKFPRLPMGLQLKRLRISRYKFCSM